MPVMPAPAVPDSLSTADLQSLGYSDLRTLYWLVVMTERRKGWLADSSRYKDEKARTLAGWDTHALSWGLERLGYPPSRYFEVKEAYRIRRAKARNHQGRA